MLVLKRSKTRVLDKTVEGDCMPPKAKFTKEQIISKAFEIVKEEGLDALTARYLGEKLGSSARPIFTVFGSMDEVEEGVIKKAKQLYNEYVNRGLSYDIAFKGVGTEYIKFAMNEPKLFQMLFMTGHEGKGVDVILPIIDDNYADILKAIMTAYGIDKENALRLYRHLWIYTHGIATLCATNTCSFSADEISAMMTDVFLGLLKRIKEGKL